MTAPGSRGLVRREHALNLLTSQTNQVDAGVVVVERVSAAHAAGDKNRLACLEAGHVINFPSTDNAIHETAA